MTHAYRLAGPEISSDCQLQPEVVPLINSQYDPLHCLYEFATDLILFLIY